MPEKKQETRTTHDVPRRRRSRATDGDAEVNAPGEPSSGRAAPSPWARRSHEMPGRKSVVKAQPWKEPPVRRESPDDEEDDDIDDEDLPHPGQPPGPTPPAARAHGAGAADA